MGTAFFKTKPVQARVSEPNMMARSIGALGYGSKADTAVAGKDLAAASALRTNPKPTAKDVLADVKGPKV